MENIICQACQKEFPGEANLHKHLKAHKLRLAEYYQQYHPRYDKFDGQIIRFRNKEQYFSTDFNLRDNLKKWILKTDASSVRAYLKILLENRISKKKLIWTPSQVELRTTMMPPIQCYNEWFGDYYALCNELGLKNRFKGNGVFEVSLETPCYTIYIDSREQRPLEFPQRPFEKKTLKFGDYACSDHNISCHCYIERKSPQDFIGTLSGGYERFCRELDRATEAQAYVIILIEASLAITMDFQNQPNYFHKNVKITPEFIFHNVREIIQKYPNVQFLFVNNRTQAAVTIEKIFDSGCSYKDIDLQYFHDIGKL